MRIVVPPNEACFTISVSTEAPVIDFETDDPGPHVWKWKLHWRKYQRDGEVTTRDGRWSAAPVIKDLGGTLEIAVRGATAQSGRVGAIPPAPSQRVDNANTSRIATVHVKVIGTNPNEGDVRAYLLSKPGSDGFGAILSHETHNRHFTAHGEPIVSFDGGYGICQLTKPVPTFEECWSWKRNIDAGLVLFAEKRRAAIAYLSQQGRSYTADQLVRETVSRWNGGAYHSWDGNAWVRDPDTLCDPDTGNIGWDTNKKANQKKTTDKLHARDNKTYKRGHRAGDKWHYSGECYADAVLG